MIFRTISLPGIDGGSNGNLIIETGNLLPSHFAVVIATQHWHPAKHKSFVAKHTNRKVFETIDLNGLQQAALACAFFEEAKAVIIALAKKLCKVHKLAGKFTRDN